MDECYKRILIQSKIADAIPSFCIQFDIITIETGNNKLFMEINISLEKNKYANIFSHKM